MIEKLRTSKVMYLKYLSSCAKIEIEFPLDGANEALAILR
jgi:hypothetical protein